MSKTAIHLSKEPRYIEAIALYEKICAQQNECTQKLAELQILLRDLREKESDPLVVTMAEIDGPGTKPLLDQLTDCNRRASLLQRAAAESARRVETVRVQLTAEYLLSQRGEYVKALSVLIEALRNVAAVEAPFSAMKEAASALGYSLTDTGVLPINVWESYVEWVNERLPGLERDLDEHRDALDLTLDDRTQRVRMLRDEHIGKRRLEVGQVYELTARVAKRLRREFGAEPVPSDVVSPELAATADAKPPGVGSPKPATTTDARKLIPRIGRLA